MRIRSPTFEEFEEEYPFCDFDALEILEKLLE